MKITDKTLMVNFETEVKLGNNDAIELTMVHHAFIGNDVDVDLCVDFTNVKFLGVEIESSYQAFKDFKASLLKLGIDLDKLIDEKIEELKEEKIEDKLKLMFKGTF